MSTIATSASPAPHRAQAGSDDAPVARAATATQRSLAPQQQQQASQPCSVLLVEDDVQTVNAMRTILTMHGCEVVVARTLEQGLDLLRTNPTAIITDLMLPDGDGIEILARVREAKLPMPVVVTTSVGDPARLALVDRLKPTAVLRKPFDPTMLLRALGIS